MHAHLDRRDAVPGPGGRPAEPRAEREAGETPEAPESHAPPHVQRSFRLTSAARRSLASTRVPSFNRSTSTPSSAP